MAVLLSLTAIVGLFAGCGSNGSNSGSNSNADKGSDKTSQKDDGLVSVYLVSETSYDSDKNNEHSTISYEYDENGNLTLESMAASRIVYEYDSNNRMTQWTCYRYDDSVYERRTFKYDENGNRIWFDVDVGDYYFEYTYTYDAQGNMTECVCTRNGEHFSTDTYAYDEAGRLAEYCEGTMYHFVYTYEGNTVFKQDITPKGEVGDETIFTYDDNGYLIKEADYFYGEAESCVTYTRDASGKVLEECLYYYDDGVEELEKRSVYTYDENGNLAEVTIYEEDEIFARRTYTYTELRVTPQRAQELQEQAAEKD